MLSDAEIYQVLTEIFNEVFRRDDMALTSELAVEDLREWDSIRQIEIIMAMEERFGIRIDTHELDGFQNVGALAALVRAKVP